jgi:hypothetical protein
MSAKKAKPKSNLSFWKPKKVGEFIDGRFAGFYSSQYGLNLGIEVGKEVKYVGCNHTVIKHLVKDNFDTIKNSKRIKIVFFEKKKYFIFKIFVDGEELVGNMQLKTVSDKEAKALLESTENE